MANHWIESSSDSFMPEYWPANRLIGELENILVKAQNIIGEIEGKQIKNLEAGKIIGELTNEQIKEIAAAKIAGQLTNAQIESLAAAKLLGQIQEVQIANGAISANKIAANAVTAEKILAESITALKISAGAVTTAKIAAGAITAEKLSVEKLSAITANLGTVTAGVIEGVDIKLPESTNEKEYPDVSKIEWLAGGKIHSWLGAFGEAFNASVVKLIANETKERKSAVIELESIAKNGRYGGIEIAAFEEESQLWFRFGTSLLANGVMIYSSNGSSGFVQLPGNAKRFSIGGIVGSTGVIGAGIGFAVTRISKGNYKITASEEFPSTPAVTITMAGSTSYFLPRWYLGTNPKKEIMVQLITISGTEFVDGEFSFKAFG